MNRIRRSSKLRKSVGALCTILAAALAGASFPASAQDFAGFRIVVLEGEDSVNIIAQGTAVPTLVEVRDRNDLPVAGASVLFLLGEGGTATLNAGLSQVVLTTNALGQAAVTVNPLTAGAVNLSVSATLAGETATVAIVQTNFATLAEAAAAGLGTTGGGGGVGAGAGGAGAGGGGIGMGTVIGITGAAVGGTLGVREAIAWGGRKVDQEVLKEIYNKTGGDGWKRMCTNKWRSDEPLDTWHGVTTDGGGRVTRLELSDCNLTGNFLTDRNNKLEEDVPWFVPDPMANLKVLNVKMNHLGGDIGNIPQRIMTILTNLDLLDLRENSFSGTIPNELCRFDINPQRGNEWLDGCGPPPVSSGLVVADANATENTDDTIDFTVTLAQAASEAVRVDYATADGSAKAGADYTAKSGTLTFSPGERSKTVQVDILDDTHDEGEETFTLTLSNASGVVIVDGQATGRIENHDPLPRALLARFGRTAAVHVVEQVEERLQAPREPGVDGRLAGQELRSRTGPRLGCEPAGSSCGAGWTRQRPGGRRPARHGWGRRSDGGGGRADGPGRTGQRADERWWSARHRRRTPAERLGVRPEP